MTYQRSAGATRVAMGLGPWRLILSRCDVPCPAHRPLSAHFSAFAQAVPYALPHGALCPSDLFPLMRPSGPLMTGPLPHGVFSLSLARPRSFLFLQPATVGHQEWNPLLLYFVPLDTSFPPACPPRAWTDSIDVSSLMHEHL